MKASNQRVLDTRRRVYLVTFPREVQYDTVKAFMRAISGLHRKPGLTGLPSIFFEVEADEAGIRHRIGIPRDSADFIIAQLRALLPGVRVVLEDPKLRRLVPREYSRAIELSLTDPSMPLRIGHPDAIVSTLLASFHPLKPGEQLLLQWVVAPSVPQRLPTAESFRTIWPFGPMQVSGDVLAAQRLKADDHLFSAVGRIAAKAESENEADRLVKRLFNGLNSVRSSGTRFKTRLVRQETLLKRINEAAVPHALPISFNATELATLVAWPIGVPQVPGLPSGRSRHMSADAAIPSSGLVLGTSNFPGAERPLALAPLDRMKHLHLMGPTGVGKSTLITNLVTQEMQAGYGVAVLDPKGDLIADVLDRIPESRKDDVILLDPTDVENPVGFNVLAGADPELVTDQIMNIFHNLYSDSWGPRMADVLRTSVLTLAQVPGMTLVEIPYLLTDEDFRDSVVRQVKDRVLKDYWRVWEGSSKGERAQSIAPVMNKLRPLLLRQGIRASLGQASSGFEMTKVLSEGKILLVSLSKGQLGEETAGLFGSLVVAKLWQAVQGRSAIPSSDRTPFFCHVDEFQDYLNLPMSVADVLAQARGYGFGLTLAHQHLGQLPTQLRTAVLTNARSKVVFQTSAEDARVLAREMAPGVEPEDLQNLGKYETVVKLTVGDQAMAAATATTMPASRPTGLTGYVRATSRKTYGRPFNQVEQEFIDRHQQLFTPPKRPAVGREEESS